MTFCSSLAGVTVMPAFAISVCAALPHGTSGAQSTTVSGAPLSAVIAPSARSSSDRMASGLPGATAISSTLVANSTGSPVDEAGIVDLGHVVLVGGREDVGPRALDELRGEHGRAVVRDRQHVDARVGLLELDRELVECRGQ